MSSMSATRTAGNDGLRSGVTTELAGMRQAVSDGVHGVTDSGRRLVGMASDAARRAASTARDAAIDSRDLMGKTISERPFTSVAIAAGVGALVAAALVMFMRRGD